MLSILMNSSCEKKKKEENRRVNISVIHQKQDTTSLKTIKGQKEKRKKKKC